MLGSCFQRWSCSSSISRRSSAARMICTSAASSSFSFSFELASVSRSASARCASASRAVIAPAERSGSTSS